MRQFERIVGLRLVRAFHLNDCKKDLGCRVDRHEHIGKGYLGLDAFRWLMNDPRFDGIPMLLETPKGEDCAEDRENLSVLRGLVVAPK
jgi:deoxyribonuclease-4